MKVFLPLIIFILSVNLKGQDTLKNSRDSTSGTEYLIQKVERNGITMPEIEIKEVTVAARPNPFTSRKSDYRKYERLIYNLKKVYPYAIIVRNKLGEVNQKLAGMTSEKEKKEYIKQFEKDVFKEYEDDMRHMTISQGRLLIKLIDRETSNTSYDLIRQYRGKFSAAFWQGIAKLFGTDLKEEYDGYGDDALIEILLNEIDSGEL